uniref:Uncharacterized protein n=1 Tax=Arundo donax TaxID=35708 RepID=A0A0A9APQ6_ARUDO
MVLFNKKSSVLLLKPQINGLLTPIAPRNLLRCRMHHRAAQTKRSKITPKSHLSIHVLLNEEAVSSCDFSDV